MSHSRTPIGPALNTSGHALPTILGIPALNTQQPLIIVLVVERAAAAVDDNADQGGGDTLPTH